MKKELLILTFILFLIFSVNSAKAQISFLIGPNIGASTPTGDYAGDVTDFYNGTKYGLKTGVNIGASAKINLLFINGRADLNYCWLSNNGSIGTNNGTVDTKQNLFTFGIGPEYKLNIPMSPVKPYFSIELLISSISGESTFHGVAGVSSNTISFSSTSRTGMGVILGSEINFVTFTLDFSVRYNLHNLGGKSFSSYNNNDRTNSYSALNDDKDPNYGGDKHPVNSSRSISTVQLNVGVLFGL